MKKYHVVPQYVSEIGMPVGTFLAMGEKTDDAFVGKLLPQHQGTQCSPQKKQQVSFLVQDYRDPIVVDGELHLAFEEPQYMRVPRPGELLVYKPLSPHTGILNHAESWGFLSHALAHRYQAPLYRLLVTNWRGKVEMVWSGLRPLAHQVAHVWDAENNTTHQSLRVYPEFSWQVLQPGSTEWTYCRDFPVIAR